MCPKCNRVLPIAAQSSTRGSRKCKDCQRAAGRRWGRENRERLRRSNRLARVRQRVKVLGRTDCIIHPDAYAETGEHVPCAYCGELGATHEDHIIPLSGEGHHIQDNLCAACPNCNAKKGEKTIAEWIEDLAHYGDPDDMIPRLSKLADLPVRHFKPWAEAVPLPGIFEELDADNV